MKRYPSSNRDWASLKVELTDVELLIGGWQVMQRWEEPLMRVLATEVTRNGGDILEVGFGVGISATAIMESGCASYTVIEAHPVVAQAARDWGERHSDAGHRGRRIPGKRSYQGWARGLTASCSTRTP